MPTEQRTTLNTLRLDQSKKAVLKIVDHKYQDSIQHTMRMRAYDQGYEMFKQVDEALKNNK